MTLAGVVNMCVALVLGNHDEVTWETKSLLAILYLVVAGSWIGFTAYIWLLRHVPTSKVATYAYVNPIVAVFLGWFILDEKIDAFILAGTAIIVVGVAMVTGAKVKKRGAPAEEDLPACESTG
jgi:drug/metabolite transporter (DMT)-like permease